MSDVRDADDASARRSSAGGHRAGRGPDARRRQFLRAWAVPAAATAVAGCSAIDGNEDPLVDDLEPGDTTGYGGAIRFGDAYAMTVTDAASGTTTMAGRFDGPDRYLRYDEDGTTVESYLVDGDGYVLADGECTRYPELDAGLQSVESVTRRRSDGDSADPGVTVTGRADLDGRRMLVLEPTDGETAATYHVDEESRYLRRVETAATVVDYRGWGEVGAIDPPDVDCQPTDGA